MATDVRSPSGHAFRVPAPTPVRAILGFCALIAVGVAGPAAAGVEVAGDDPATCIDDADCPSGFCLDGLCLEDVGETPAFSLPTPTPTPLAGSCAGAECGSSDGGGCRVGPSARGGGPWFAVPAALVWWWLRRRRA